MTAKRKRRFGWIFVLSALLVGAGSAPVPAPGAVWLAALAALVVLFLGGGLAALRRKAVPHAA